MRTLILLAVLVLALCGCTAWNSGMAGVNSYAGAQITAQEQNLQGLNDNAAAAWQASACAIPYGTLARGNTRLSAAVIELCGPPSGFLLTRSSGATVSILPSTAAQNATSQ